MKFAKLNTGASIPVLGLGTGSDNDLSLDERKAAVSAAVEIGYRHFDTAHIYNSEGLLGEALADAIQSGKVKREELFVTSKLWCSDSYPEGVLPALKRSLSALQLQYLDLYLIHWPARFKQGVGKNPTPDDLLPLDLKGTWKAMEECMTLGLTRAIGVSNFSSKKILDLLAFAEIPPAVNQVEMHPKWQQKNLRETCCKANILLTGWSPLGAPLMKYGSDAVLDNPIIKSIALKHGKTPAQVALRWALEQGVSVVPRSFNRKRISENFQVFDWQLDSEDHESIERLDQKKNVDAHFLCNPERGPNRNVNELWDGEI